MVKIIFLCCAGFLAAIVDSIAGGGGLISVPAFMIAGLPTPYVLGTNKLCASTSSFTSSIGFMRSKKVNFNILKYLIPFTLIGAFLGVNTVLKMNQKLLNILILVLIFFIGIYSLVSKSLGLENKFKGITKKNLFLGILLAFCLGFYDGFFGPGTGSFLIFGFVKIFGYDFVNATGNARTLNFTSNILSLILFAIHKKILYVYAIPVAIFMMIGAKVGTKLALKKGSRLIKPIFVIMSLGIAAKLLINVLK